MYAIGISLLAIVLAHILSKFEIPKQYKKFQSLDGLRGMAALFVFIHHSAIWYTYKTSGIWTDPPSNLYTHFGQGGVIIFFMLTGFLFWGKIRGAKQTDWIKLYSSRVMRIMPLYLFSAILLIAVAYYCTPPAQHVFHLHDYTTMLLFRGTPDLFGMHNTWIINAAVTWTLTYEWMFYSTLPIMSVVAHPSSLKIKALVLAAIYGGLIYIAFTMYQLHSHFLLLFVLGILTYEVYVAAFAKRLRQLISGVYGSLLVAMLSLTLVLHYHSGYSVPAELLYFMIFLIIASGNTMFGILASQALTKLGEISYSIYLLQGVVLYTIFQLGNPPIHGLPLHWLTVSGALLLLVLLSNFTYFFIERPFMDRAPSLAIKLQSFWKRNIKPVSP
jgi:peptidoglycan/LPS O-acetylase OafA/YrhL